MTLFGYTIDPWDAALALAGVLGAVCFFWLLGAQHPGSAADYGLSKEKAVAGARRFVEDEGGFLLPDDATRSVYVHKNADLLDALQAATGRPEAVRLLEGEAGARLPGYHWHVRWRQSVEDGDDREVDVLLNKNGLPYDLDTEQAADWTRHTEAANRPALRAALRAGTEPSVKNERTENPAPLSTVPDLLLQRYLAFDLSEDKASEDDASEHEDASEDASSEALPGRPTSDSLAAALMEHLKEGTDVFRVPSLGRRAAARMARYHLRQTALRGYSFRLDTVRATQQAGRETATARLWGSRFHGQRPRVDVEVAPTGTLLRLDTQFEHDGLPRRLASTDAGSSFYRPPTEGEQAGAENGDAQPREDGGDVNISIAGGDTAAGIVTGVMYVLLAAASLFLFVRRSNARVVDTSAALRDALWGGFFAGAMMVMVMAGGIFQEESFWVAVLIVSVTVVFTAGGGAFLIFLSSGAMDSVARASWPEKVTTLTLLRHGALRNVPLGKALLRGLAVAFALLGATTLLMVLFPQATLDFSASDSGPPAHLVLSHVGYLFGAVAWTGLFVGLTVLLGWGTWLYRRRPAAWWVVPGVALALVLAQVGVAHMAPLGFHALFLAVVGLGLAGAFWQYDFVTVFIALLLAGLLWGTAGGWMNEGAPEALDAALALGAAALVLGVGLVGAFSGRTSTEVPAYVPTYVEELAEQERLQRDIEIAEEVQRSFLPRRMPQIEGLDVAALCLPAREVGGDYYDFIELPDGRLAVALGDVSGKGIEASFFMTLAKGFLQTLATAERPPAEVLRRLNTLFCRNAPRGTFITMIYGVADPAEGTFRFARAGHNPPIHHCASKDGGPQTANCGPAPENGNAPENGKRSAPRAERPAQTRLLQPGGLAIGLTDGPRFAEALEEITIPLSEGDALVLYTDGFPEARNAGGAEFGQERLLQRVRRHASAPAAHALMQDLANDVHAFVEAAGRHDDMTMVVLRFGKGSEGKRGRMGERGSGRKGEGKKLTTEN